MVFAVRKSDFIRLSIAYQQCAITILCPDSMYHYVSNAVLNAGVVEANVTTITTKPEVDKVEQYFIRCCCSNFVDLCQTIFSNGVQLSKLWNFLLVVATSSFYIFQAVASWSSCCKLHPVGRRMRVTYLLHNDISITPTEKKNETSHFSSVGVIILLRCIST